MNDEEKYIQDLESYNFSIIALLKEGFNRTYGVKFIFFGALAIYAIIAFITAAVLEVIFPQNVSVANDLLSSLLSMPITLPILIGITLLGIKQARDEKLDIPSIFNYFNMLGSIIIVYLAMGGLIFLGFLVLVLPGIYLAVSYTFVYPLIVDKGLGTWEAMELSRKTITKQWFKFFGLGIVSGFLIIISAIPLGVGLIWSVPTVYISYGLLYHHLFDEEG